MPSLLRPSAGSISLSLLLIAPILVAQQGCEDDPYDPGLHVEEHACVHFEDGPVEEITAAANPVNAPDMSEHHTRYDIEMVSYDGGMGGYTSFEADEHGILLIFSDQPAEMQLLDDRLNPIDFEDIRPTSEACALIGARYVAHVDAERYFIEFGPAGVPPVISIAIEEGEDSH